MITFLLSLVTMFVLLGSSTSLAQVNQSLTVDLTYGSDLTPPTSPTITSIIPVTQSQIDLVWSVSIDDFSIGGYQLFRDSIAIATTSLTSYSDTGLAPSTTYSYAVRAFDSSFNYSTTSVAAATTTLVAIVTPTTTPTTTPTGSRGGGQYDLELESFLITPHIYSAAFQWQTDRYSRFALRWGRTGGYESGFVSSDIFKHDHQTVIANLEPGTTYNYILIGYARNGSEEVLNEGQFTTLSSVDVTAPPNVYNLQAVHQNNNVTLTWQNPAVTDFAYVRIVRSHLFYPTNPYAGQIVYQGSAESFFDNNTLDSYGTQFYTVFTYDQNGNVSSGAITRAVQTISGLIQPLSPTVTPSTSTSPTNNSIGLTLSDVSMMQGNRVMLLNDTKLRIDGGVEMTVSIPYDAVPQHLKAIVVTLTHPSDETLTFSFLLRVNKDQSAYEATIAPLQVGGVFGVSITLFDFTTGVATELYQSVPVTVFATSTAVTSVVTYRNWWSVLIGTISFCLLLSLLLWRVLDRKRSSKEWGTTADEG